MRQVDIKRLFLFQAEYQELDPKVAADLLQRILEVLQAMRRMRIDDHRMMRKESVDE